MFKLKITFLRIPIYSRSKTVFHPFIGNNGILFVFSWIRETIWLLLLSEWKRGLKLSWVYSWKEEESERSFYCNSRRVTKLIFWWCRILLLLLLFFSDESVDRQTNEEKLFIAVFPPTGGFYIEKKPRRRRPYLCLPLLWFQKSNYTTICKCIF